MCLAAPGRVVEVRDEERGLVDFSGIRKEVGLALLEGVEVGDYVLVHAGYALERLDPREAERTLALIDGMRTAG